MKYAHPNRERRKLLAYGAGLMLFSWAWHRASAEDEVQIQLAGTPNGSHVWYRPSGLLIEPGQAVRWINRDSANVHTITAYHPANRRPLRLPVQAKPWNSDYLMPGESFGWVFDLPGVYDYFCIPHEHAGMVGRIVVGQPSSLTEPYVDTNPLLPQAAVASFPPLAEILASAPTPSEKG